MVLGKIMVIQLGDHDQSITQSINIYLYSTFKTTPVEQITLHIKIKQK